MKNAWPIALGVGCLMALASIVMVLCGDFAAGREYAVLSVLWFILAELSRARESR